MPAPVYHNPNPLVRLIGPANEGKVKIEGVETTALIDMGACMSAITKSFAEALELDIQTCQPFRENCQLPREKPKLIIIYFRSNC